MFERKRVCASWAEINEIGAGVSALRFRLFLKAALWNNSVFIYLNA